MNRCGVGAKAVALTNSKRVEIVEVDMSELTQNSYDDLHREGSSEGCKDFVPSRKNSKRRSYELPSKSNQETPNQATKLEFQDSAIVAIILYELRIGGKKDSIHT